MVEMHTTDIQPHPQVIVEPEQITEPLPLNLAVTRAEIWKAHLGSEQIAYSQNLSRIQQSAHQMRHPS